MKRMFNIAVLSTLFAVFTIVQVSAQEKHKEIKNWPELNAFHETISQTFHPAEKGNFKPIRESSPELHDKAVKLASAKIPAEFDRPGMAAIVKEIENKTNELNDLVAKKATDKEIKKVLFSVHDSFHKIVELCAK